MRPEDTAESGLLPGLWPQPAVNQVRAPGDRTRCTGRARQALLGQQGHFHPSTHEWATWHFRRPDYAHLRDRRMGSGVWSRLCPWDPRGHEDVVLLSQHVQNLSFPIRLSEYQAQASVSWHLFCYFLMNSFYIGYELLISADKMYTDTNQHKPYRLSPLPPIESKHTCYFVLLKFFSLGYFIFWFY